MPISIEVRRIRSSATQGEAAVYVNGKHVLQFGDTIQLIEPGQKYYGNKIGNWASIKPDSDFILGLFFHPFDNIYHYSELAKKAIIDSN